MWLKYTRARNKKANNFKKLLLDVERQRVDEDEDEVSHSAEL